MYMQYVWDPNKRKSNIRKHGIDFVDAIAVLEDNQGLTKVLIENDEQRYLTLGIGSKSGVLIVVHVEEGEDTIAIISARPADRRERRQYFEGEYDE